MWDLTFKFCTVFRFYSCTTCFLSHRLCSFLSLICWRILTMVDDFSSFCPWESSPFLKCRTSTTPQTLLKGAWTQFELQVGHAVSLGTQAWNDTGIFLGIGVWKRIFSYPLGVGGTISVALKLQGTEILCGL